MDLDQVLLVMTNVPDHASAEAVARGLVERRLAACVNCLPGVKSTYWWQGRLEQSEEICLLIKTTRAHYVELEAAVQSLHPYEIPEIVAVPIAHGLPAYLDWIIKETQKDGHADGYD